MIVQKCPIKPEKLCLKVKSEGYDGNDNEELNSPSQWNFSGALLYSVTIITTIGKQNWSAFISIQ